MTRLRRTALTRRTELARTPLRRKQATARVAAAKRTVAKQRRRRDTGPTEDTKTMLWQRAGGRCELCRRDLTSGFPFSRHHRRPRQMGGSTVPWVNDITNLLLLCGTATTPGGCHTTVESDRARAYDAGWLIRATSDYLPAEVPVLLHPRIGERPVYLTSDGLYADGVA
jgi:hypothetical protein